MADLKKGGGSAPSVKWDFLTLHLYHKHCKNDNNVTWCLYTHPELLYPELKLCQCIFWKLVSLATAPLTLSQQVV